MTLAISALLFIHVETPILNNPVNHGHIMAPKHPDDIGSPEGQYVPPHHHKTDQEPVTKGSTAGSYHGLKILQIQI